MRNKIYRYVLLWMILLVLGISITYENQWYTASLAFSVLLLVDRSVFRILLRWKFTVFLLIMIGIIPLIAGARDSVFLGVAYSGEYVKISLVMLERGLVILLTMKMLTNHISMDQISGLLQHSRLRRFGEVFGAAMEIAPHIRSLVMNFHDDFRKSRLDRKRTNYVHWIAEFITRIILFAERYPEHTRQGEHHD